MREVARGQVTGTLLEKFGEILGSPGSFQKLWGSLTQAPSNKHARIFTDNMASELQFREERSKNWMPHRVAVAVSSHATPHSEDLLPGTSTRTAP